MYLLANSKINEGNKNFAGYFSICSQRLCDGTLMKFRLWESKYFLREVMVGVSFIFERSYETKIVAWVFL